MPIVQAGTLNTTALVVPDLYVQVVPPQNLVLNGVPTNFVGVVGTASWGPVNTPVVVGSMADYARAFGPVVARRYDMGTPVATAVQQGAQAFRCVRVTDGMDVAASYALFYSNAQYPVLITARYSGSVGNLVGFRLAPGSAAGTWSFTVGLPGQVAERFDNLPAPTPQAFWAALVRAVNEGQGALRGPSQLVVASLGSAASTPPAPLANQFLLNGTDGAGVSEAALVGADALPRTGMHALRGQGCSLLVLSDSDGGGTWNTQAGWAMSEGAYAILAGPPGQTITGAIEAKAAAGLDAWSAKLMFGDWVWWSDPVSGTVRLVSPQGFVAGRLANLSPEQSSLNKPLYGVAGTARGGLPGAGVAGGYSTAELQALLQAGIDVICTPQPAGGFWGVRGGRNTSSNAATNGDAYTRLTHYLAATLAAGMGQYVGQVITAGLFRRIRSTQMSFLQGLLGQGVLGSTDGSLPFSVVCDASNNPPGRTALGYVQSDAQVRYQAVNERFIVNLEGGQTVQVTRQTLPSGQV